MNNKIGIIGAGYVGITTGISFAEKGFNVYLCDSNKEILDSLKNNKCHFYEPGIDIFLPKICRISPPRSQSLF